MIVKITFCVFRFFMVNLIWKTKPTHLVFSALLKIISIWRFQVELLSIQGSGLELIFLFWILQVVFLFAFSYFLPPFYISIVLHLVHSVKQYLGKSTEFLTFFSRKEFTWKIEKCWYDGVCKESGIYLEKKILPYLKKIWRKNPLRGGGG